MPISNLGSAFRTSLERHIAEALFDEQSGLLIPEFCEESSGASHVCRVSQKACITIEGVKFKRPLLSKKVLMMMILSCFMESVESSVGDI